MHKSATKCNEIIGKWCKNKHGASKIIDTLETYQACIEGKMHELPHPSKIIISSKRVLELLLMDLFGPPTYASLGGKKYCLVIIDDYSRYTWVFFLAHKSETQQTVKDFTNEVQHQYGQDILMIQSDNGTEFKNYTLNDFLSDEGIRHQYSSPCTPQQNGVSEWKNWTLIDMARTMLVMVIDGEGDYSSLSPNSSPCAW
jgi:transposase InsO family protein